MSGTVQSWYSGRLSTEQADHITRWLPGARLCADMSWNLVDTVVLDVESERGRCVIKAAGRANHPIGREITAHHTVTECLVRTGHAAALVEHDRSANLLVTRYVDGSLVMGSEAEFDCETYRQAGVLLRTFHDQAARIDAGWEAAAVAKSLAWLKKPNRISESVLASVQEILVSHRPQPVVVVPTHGDWQPRNWLVDQGKVKVIDFGRFDWRPAMSDFCRLAARQWSDNAALEHAFLAGYGSEPRDPEQWRLITLHEAIGTAVWAYQVGDEPFENEGHRMIANALDLF